VEFKSIVVLEKGVYKEKKKNYLAPGMTGSGTSTPL